MAAAESRLRKDQQFQLVKKRSRVSMLDGRRFCSFGSPDSGGRGSGEHEPDREAGQGHGADPRGPEADEPEQATRQRRHQW